MSCFGTNLSCFLGKRQNLFLLFCWDYCYIFYSITNSLKTITVFYCFFFFLTNTQWPRHKSYKYLVHECFCCPRRVVNKTCYCIISFQRWTEPPLIFWLHCQIPYFKKLVSGESLEDIHIKIKINSHAINRFSWHTLLEIHNLKGQKLIWCIAAGDIVHNLLVILTLRESQKWHGTRFSEYNGWGYTVMFL